MAFSASWHTLLDELDDLPEGATLVTPLSHKRFRIDGEYVRKAEVDEEVKETRLQGLKEQLATTEGEEAEELRQEIEDLEGRIDELTSFRTGTEVLG